MADTERINAKPGWPTDREMKMKKRPEDDDREALAAWIRGYEDQISAALYAAMLERHLDTVELADLLGIHHTTACAYLGKTRTIGPKDLAKIGVRLGLTRAGIFQKGEAALTPATSRTVISQPEGP